MGEGLIWTIFDLSAASTRLRFSGSYGLLRALRGRLWALQTGRCWSTAVNRGQPKTLVIIRLLAKFLRTPNGIRTRAATLKGWKLLRWFKCEIPRLSPFVTTNSPHN